MKKVSIRTIAAAVGVAPCTVSRALHRNPLVDAATRNRILKAAASLGYSKLHRLERPVILVTAPPLYFQGIYEVALLRELQRVLARKEFQFLLIASDEKELIRQIHPDGIISICYDIASEKLISENLDLPVVSINNFSLHLENIYTVVSDEEEVFRHSIEHLISLGHRRIGILQRNDEVDRRIINFSISARKDYFLRMARQFGLCGKSYSYLSNATSDNVLLQALDDRMTALICPAEGREQEIRLAIKRIGLRIPEDFSLIFWENPDISKYMNPPSTAFMQNYRGLAEKAVEMLENIFANGFSALHDCKVEYLFFNRATTAPPPGKPGKIG